MARTLNISLVVLLGFLFLSPLIHLLYGWIGGEWFNLLQKKSLSLILKSIFYSGLSAFFATLFGSITAFLLTRIHSSYRKWYFLLLLLPMLISPYIVAVAWRDLFGIWIPQIGDGAVGVILVHTLIFTPFAMIILFGAFLRINAPMLEAAQMIISYPKLILKILFPLIRPSIGISFILIFIFSLNEFSVPTYFHVNTFITEIFTQFSAFYNTQFALSQSLLLLLFSLLIVAKEIRMLKDSPFFAIDLKGNRIISNKKSTSTLWLYIVLSAFVFLSVVFPLSSLIYRATHSDGFSWIQALALMDSAIIHSIGIAFVGSLSALVIGWCSAWLSERKQKKLPESILLLMFVIPSTTFAISAISFYNTEFLHPIYSSFWILIIGYTARFGFIASRMIANGYKQLPIALEEAAILMSSSKWRRFIVITLPLLAPSLFGSFILLFIFIIGEISMTIMLYPPGIELMGIKIYTISANAPQTLSDAMIVINLITVLGIIALFTITWNILFTKEKYA